MGCEEAEDVIADCQDVIDEAGSCMVMVDGRHTQSMAPEFRRRMTDWMAAHRHQITIHLLQNSKLMAMAIHVANLVIKQPVAFPHTKLETWEKVIITELGSFDRRLLEPPDLPVAVPTLSA